jgi:hypothetical protein
MKNHKKRPKPFLTYIINFVSAFYAGHAAYAQTLIDPATLTTTPVTEVQDLNSGLSVSTGFTALSAVSESVTGLDFSLRYHFAIDRKWAVAGEASQGLNTAGFNTLYTALSAIAVYSKDAMLIPTKKITKIGNQPVTTTREYTGSGWFFQGGIKQYFFNGSSSVLPLIGPTLGAYYQFSSAKNLTMQAGATYDMGQNNDRTLGALKIYVGVMGFR